MVLRNPGGEHLSSDMVNLPGIYDSLTVFWAIIIGYVALTCVLGSEKRWARVGIAALSRDCVVGRRTKTWTFRGGKRGDK